jgi:hypothetical protein
MKGTKAKMGKPIKDPMTRTGNEKSKGMKSERGQSAVKKNYKEKNYKHEI